MQFLVDQVFCAMTSGVRLRVGWVGGGTRDTEGSDLGFSDSWA